MSADLAVYTASESALDRLDRHAVVALLERGKTWLDMAVARDTEIGEFVEFKGQAETVRVYTVQKQLGKDAELAAAELVRRAERGIGLAIRKGQEAGEIRRHGDRGPVRAAYTRERNGRVETVQAEAANTSISLKPGPTDFVSQHELSSNGAGIYHLTDGVTDDQFEAGIAEAKTAVQAGRPAESDVDTHPACHESYRPRAAETLSGRVMFP